MKCQHDGEKITGWDEVTCRKCGWIVPSGQSMGIHDGWFPSHDAHKEFKKYHIYTGMDNTYPIDATKYDEVQNMTQTNNERELLLKIKDAICMAIYSDDGLDGVDGENLIKAIDEVLSPISQNEQQEEVASLEDWLTINMPSGTFIGDPLWWARKIRNVLAFTERNKQAIPAVNVSVPYELLKRIMDNSEEIILNDFVHVAVQFEIFSDLEDIFDNATPTNTEVGG